jgi:hypothetical protein
VVLLSQLLPLLALLQPPLLQACPAQKGSQKSASSREAQAGCCSAALQHRRLLQRRQGDRPHLHWRALFRHKAQGCSLGVLVNPCPQGLVVVVFWMLLLQVLQMLQVLQVRLLLLSALVQCLGMLWGNLLAWRWANLHALWALLWLLLVQLGARDPVQERVREAS